MTTGKNNEMISKFDKIWFLKFNFPFLIISLLNVFSLSLAGRKYAMLKLKVLLSTILRNYRIHSDLKEEDFKLQADIILKREEGFQVRIERRKSMAKA